MNIHLPAILMFTRGIGFWPMFKCFLFESWVYRISHVGLDRTWLIWKRLLGETAWNTKHV
jgi:hypothetical protein